MCRNNRYAPPYLISVYYDLDNLIDLSRKLSWTFNQIYVGCLYSTPFIILAMTVERYIFVVHAASAKKILSRKNRMILYTMLSVVILALPVFRVVDILVNNPSGGVRFLKKLSVKITKLNGERLYKQYSLKCSLVRFVFFLATSKLKL